MSNGDIESVVASFDGDRTALRRVLLGLKGNDAQLSVQVGSNLNATDPSQVLSSPNTVPNWSVIGIDGHFYVRINPLNIELNPQSAQMNSQAPSNGISGGVQQPSALNIIIANPPNQVAVLYEIQSSTNLLWDASGSVVDYPPSDALSYDITQYPNQSRYWRIRAQFPNGSWTAWFIYSGPKGALQIYSGQLRSTSAVPNMAVNTSNNCTVDSVDAGASDTIRVYGPGGLGTSWTHFDGQSGQTVIPPGSILGAAYATSYTVDWGSSVSQAPGYSAFPNSTQFSKSLLDTLIFAASIKTVAAGGGGGVSGGGGAGGGSDGGAGGGGGRPFDLP